jgi:hypothetical protein
MRQHAPPPVVNAVRLMVLRAGIGLISIVVLLLTRDDFKKRILERTPTASDATIDTALWVGVGVGVVILVFYLLLARLVRQGVNWARVVTWVIAGLGILGAVTGFSQPAPPASRILTVVGGIIDIVIVVLLVQRPSHEYFRDQAAR